MTVSFHGYLDWIDVQSDLPQQICCSIAPSIQLHSDIYRLLACSTISLGYLLVHPEQIGNKVIIQNHMGRSPAASVPAAMWELNRKGKAISPSIARAPLPTYWDAKSKTRFAASSLQRKKEERNAERASWKIDCRSGSRFQSYRSEREREKERKQSGMRRLLYHIMSPDDSAPDSLISLPDKPPPSYCSFPFFFFPVRWESTHSGLVPWIAHYIVDKEIYGLFLLYTNHIRFWVQRIT